MPVVPSRHSLSARVLAFVSLTTLASALAVSWIAIDTHHSAVRSDLERRLPAALARQHRALEAWLEQQGSDLAHVLQTPAQLPLLELGLDESDSDPSLQLQIVDDSGEPIAGSLEPAPFRHELARALPTLGIPRAVDGPGDASYAIARPIGDTGFHLIGGVARASAFASSRGVALRLIAADVCLVLLFSLLAVRITRRILRPIQLLSAGAQRVSRGELFVRLELPRSHGPDDEIGVLARAFEGMLRRLRTSQREIERNNERLRSQNEQLQQTNTVLEQLSITDGLTNLHNHRYFQELLIFESNRIERTKEPLSLMLIDLDDFKRLNDRYGHAAGDQVLERLARVLSETIRESDVVARYGGEEFVVLSTGTDQHGARVLAEKIRLTVEQTDFPIDERPAPALVTVSIGVAEYDGCRKRLFRAADAALYRAKELGRNCVVEADSPSESQTEGRPAA